MKASLSLAGRPRWIVFVWGASIAVGLLVIAVLVGSWLRGLPAVDSFIADYPGQSAPADGAPVGLPAWLGWQHFANLLFLLLIVRSGWLIRTRSRALAYWSPAPPRRRSRGSGRQPPRISLDLWLHLALDILWMLNGASFLILLFATGQWMRIVPTSWDVFPNAVSAAIQYASLDWPVDDGWANYNALQLLSYFAVVFIAAPLAIATGVRMSPIWPSGRAGLDRIYPIGLARAIHFPVMLFFVLFTIVHVALVLATGAIANLNHIYAARDDQSWIGLTVFAISLVAIVAAWVAATPVIVASLAGLTGKVTR